MKTVRGFTLLELLVVAGLIAAFAAFAFRSMDTRGGAALQSGQAVLANLIVAARTKAIATGRPVRLLVNVDPRFPDRFLDQLVVQVQDAAGWKSEHAGSLPEGVSVVPGNFTFPSGLFGVGEAGWVRSDGSTLRSTALRGINRVTVAAEGSEAEEWVALPFAAVGTTNSPGDIVLALSRRRAPSGVAGGESPTELIHPEQVRGVSLSTYGVATLIEGRASF